jgi:hypothetical protein
MNMKQYGEYTFLYELTNIKKAGKKMCQKLSSKQKLKMKKVFQTFLKALSKTLGKQCNQLKDLGPVV